MKNKPKVSVIIPHRGDRPEWLKEAKDSIDEQTFRDFELIEQIGPDLEKLNTAVKRSKGEYIIFLSDDDKFPPYFLQNCVNAIEKENNIDIVAPGLESFGDVPANSEGKHLPGLYPFYSSMFKRTIYDKVGGFDPDMVQAIDVDFWYRCINAGARWVVCSDTYYLYRNHGSQDSVTCNWEIVRDRLFKKHKDYKW